MIYGNSLKNKLEVDVVTKSQDIVDALNSTATDKALSAKQGKTLSDQIGSLIVYEEHQVSFVDGFGEVPTKNGYQILCITPNQNSDLLISGIYRANTGKWYAVSSTSTMTKNVVIYYIKIS